MRHSDSLLRAAFVATLMGAAIAFAAAQQKPLFTFHRNAWLNLHHYVRAAARGGGPAPTTLTPEEQNQWAAGVKFYKPYAARDVLRDDGMVAIASALRGAGCFEKMAEHWTPHLDGKRSIADALSSLVAAFK